MYRSILGAHATILLSLALFTCLPLTGHTLPPGPALLARCTVGGVLLATAGVVASRGEHRANLAVLAATFLLVTPFLGDRSLPNDATVGMLLSACGVMAARLLPLVKALGLVTTLSMVHTATLTLLDLPSAGLSLDATVLSLGTASAAVGFVNAMQVRASETERITEANRRRELEVARGEAELAARATSRRVLHDDVLGTLHLVSDGIAAADRVRTQCRATAAAVRRVVGDEVETEVPVDDAGDAGPAGLPTAYAVLVGEVLASAPVPVEVSVVGRAARLPALPDEQRAVAVRALAEGVRNAVRHGRADRVSLRISTDRRGVRLELLDRGVGLVSQPRRGFGLVESVERPLATIGGSAALLARPGGGAALVLTLPRDPGQGGRVRSAHGLTTGGLGSVRMLSRAVAVPLGLAWCVIAAHSVASAPGTWASLVVGVGWLALTTVIVRRSERRSPDPLWVGAVALATLLLQVVGIALMPPGAMLDFRSWSIGVSALPLVVLVLVLPVPVATAVLSCHLLVVLGAAVVRPDLTGGQVPWGSLNAVVTCPVPSMVLGSLIRRQGRSLVRQQEHELALAHRLAGEQWQVAMADLYLAHVRQEVLPWLEEIADGRRDPSSPDAAARSRLLAVAARDDLYAPGFFDDELRADVAYFRSRGGTVELRAGLVPGGFQRPVGRVLRGLLPVSAGRRIIVTPPVAPERQVRISVVPAPHVGDLERLRTGVDGGFATDVDAFRAVLLVEDLPVSGDRQPAPHLVATPHDT